MAPGFWHALRTRKSSHYDDATSKNVSLVRPVIKLEIHHHIENFRSAMGLCFKDEQVLSRKVSSPRAPDFVWHVRVDPNNGSNGSAFFLQLSGPARDQKKRLNVAYNFSLRKEDGSHTLINKATSEFSPPNYVWGYKSVSHASLKRSIHADGGLLVVVTLEFFTGGTPVPTGDTTAYKLGVSDSLASLLKTGVKSDLTIMAGKEPLLAHQLILAARSPVFEAMFRHNSSYLEAKSGVLQIDNFAKQPIEGMLSFVYTGEIDDAVVDKWPESLLELADMYQLDGMKSFMEEKVAASLCVGTFVPVALLADSHYCHSLKKACADFLRDNFDQVTSSEMWKELIKGSHANAVAELLQMVHCNR